MARWTETPEEAQRISKHIHDGKIKNLIHLVLLDGQEFEGAVISTNIGNNAGENGHWSFYGGIVIKNISGREFEIDLIDVKNVYNIWKSHHVAYNEAGIIEIVDFPKSN